MITEFIINAFLAGVDAILSLIPDFTNYTEPSDGFSVGSIVGNFNQIFPIILVMQLALFAIGIRLLFNAFDLAVWIYHQFWGAS